MSAATTTGPGLAGLCAGARVELEGLGEAGAPLVVLVDAVARAGAGRGVEALADPGFALDVLAATGPGTEPALVGRVLGFLRSRQPTTTTTTGCVPVVPAAARPEVSVAEAVASYEEGALAMMAKGSGRTYRTWLRRLAAAHPDTPPREVTAGDLRDLIARHVLALRERAGGDRRVGRSAEEHAVAAYRAFWAYLVDKGWTEANVAQSLRKPGRADPNRRDIRPDEAALVRQLAVTTGRDPLLDEVTLTIPERLGLRNIEVLRLRLCDLHLRDCTGSVWGKGDKERLLPLPPGLTGLLERYVEDRRPAHLSAAVWLASEETLLRRPPAGTFPLGRPAGRARIEKLYDRLKPLAPEVFARGDICLHSYRHAAGTYLDLHYPRSVTRAVLGHTSKQSATDVYVHVHTFCTSAVDGLFQTPDYARTVIRAAEPVLTDDDVDYYMRLRLTRQQMLTRTSPPLVTAVLDEAVLHRVVGGPDVMATQVRHLQDQAQRPNVEMQILPFSAGDLTSSEVSFRLFTLPEPLSRVVCIDASTGVLYVEPPGTDRFVTKYDTLREKALSTEDTIEFLDRSADTIEKA